jgi:hypothetical protein
VVEYTVVEYHTRLAPLLAKGGKGRGDGLVVREMDTEKKDVVGTIFWFEGASCQRYSVALYLQGLCDARTDVLSGTDDQGDWLAHNC